MDIKVVLAIPLYFFFAMHAAIVGLAFAFHCTRELSVPRLPLRHQLVVCLVSASLAFPAVFVAYLFGYNIMKETDAYAMGAIGLACAAVSSAIITLVIVSRSQ